MARPWIFAVALGILTLVPCVGAGDQTSAADSLIVRLPPSAFPQLPAPIRMKLESLGFRVPQPFAGANVIQGHFERSDQTDWAVLGSRRGVSTILVFWSGNADQVDSLATLQDEIFLQDFGDGRTGYSRMISTIGPSAMQGLYDSFGEGEQPPVPLKHEGIEDSFMDKASVVYFRHAGKWVELVGMD